MHTPSTALKVIAHESCSILGPFLLEKQRPGMTPLSDFLEHVSYGNFRFFCALAAVAPLAHSARRGGEAFRVTMIRKPFHLLHTRHRNLIQVFKFLNRLFQMPSADGRGLAFTATEQLVLLLDR